MRHKEMYWVSPTKQDDWGTPFKLAYCDTYATKTIAEVCAPNSVEYKSFDDTLAEAKIYIREQRGTRYAADRYPMSYIESRYRGILASDGMFLVPRHAKLSAASAYVYKPKTYEDAPDDKILGKDALMTPIYAGDMLYYPRAGRGTVYIEYGIVVNITDGRGQFVCKGYDSKTNAFTKPSKITNNGTCVVVSKEQYKIKYPTRNI